MFQTGLRHHLSMRIVVLLPAFNEGRRIESVLRSLPSEIQGHELLPIVIDDGSKDDTSASAKRVSGVRVLRHRTNLGKGAAAKTGCEAALQVGADIIVLMDADGQHRSEDIAHLVEPLLNGDERLVIGSRDRTGSMPIMMRLGNTGLTLVSRILFGIKVRDSQSGFRALPASVYPKIAWLSANYAMETEMLIMAAQNKVSCVEVTIPTIYFDGYKGTTVLDGLRILKILIIWKLSWHREFRSSDSFSVS